MRFWKLRHIHSPLPVLSLTRADKYRQKYFLFWDQDPRNTKNPNLNSVNNTRKDCHQARTLEEETYLRKRQNNPQLTFVRKSSSYLFQSKMNLPRL